MGQTSDSAPDVSQDDLWRRIEECGPLVDGAEFDGMIDASGDASERVYAQTDRRRTFIAFYSWAVPTRAAIKAISCFTRGRDVLEACAGNGLWAALLTGAGANVIATDAAPPPDHYVPVIPQEAETAVRTHAECQTLLLCWPPFRNDCAYRALEAFTGDRLIFVGDPRFAADRQFHDLLLNEWRVQASLPIPAWPGLEDRAFLYMRSA